MNVSDEELLALMREGNRQAFEVIYERYWKKLYNETHRRLKDVMLVEEIVHDIFSDLWARREVLTVHFLPKYLITAVRYSVFVKYKKKKTTPTFEEPLEHIARSSFEADSLLNTKDIKQCVGIWMAMQPKKRLEVFQLKYLDDYSTREISERLGLSQKTVQNQLLTSFNSLRVFLRKLMALLFFV